MKKTEVEINTYLNENYKDYINSISIISKDDKNDIPMIDEENIKMFNYDKGIIKKIWNKLEKKYEIAAVDGLDFQNNTLYFIEFKNGKLSKKEDKLGIRLKMTESLIGLVKGFKKDSFDCDLHNLLSLKKRFILVYNEEKNTIGTKSPLEVFKNLADIYPLKLQMEEYNEETFEKVIVMSKSDFEKYYLKKYFSEILNRKVLEIKE